MYVSNNQQSFGAATFTPSALKAMSKRMGSGEFVKAQGSITNFYRYSAFDVNIDTAAKNSSRLSAELKYKNNTFENRKNWIHDDYIEETTFSRIFSSPEKFFERLIKTTLKKEKK